MSDLDRNAEYRVSHDENVENIKLLLLSSQCPKHNYSALIHVSVLLLNRSAIYNRNAEFQ